MWEALGEKSEMHVNKQVSRQDAFFFFSCNAYFKVLIHKVLNNFVNAVSVLYARFHFLFLSLLHKIHSVYMCLFINTNNALIYGCLLLGFV